MVTVCGAVAPFWGRGLKRLQSQAHPLRSVRRSLLGAWIETADEAVEDAEESGRSLLGAWIETELTGDSTKTIRVAHFWGRGLKRTIF